MAKKQLNFEEAMAQLQEITRQLDQNDITLNDSLKLFEKGIALTRQCCQLLDEAEQKVTFLTREAAAEKDEEKNEI